MPIIVPCPQCATKLSAPDHAAGKMIKCPKPGCGAITEVPAFLPVEEVAVVEAVAAPARPKPKPIQARDDDDDRPRSRRDDEEEADDRPRHKRRRDEDDEDDDRPRKKKRKKATGVSPALIAGIVIGGVLLLAGAGYGIYALIGNKSDSAGGGKKASIPRGWVEFRSDQDKFKAYFPVFPTQQSKQGGLAGPGDVQGASTYRVDPSGETPGVMVAVFRLKAGATEHARDKILDDLLRKMGATGNTQLTAPTDTTWLGLPAKQVVLEGRGGTKGGGLIRYTSTDSAIYFAMIGNNSSRAPASEENGFFDNFELLK